MQQKNFEMAVLVSGHPVREFGHQGRTFVEGRKGSSFTIRFRNNTSSRVLAVPSVDGHSVIDGDPATPKSRGYIVEAYSTLEVRGWRMSLTQSADFVFSERSKSYAAQTGGDANVGLIAIKVFGQEPSYGGLIFAQSIGSLTGGTGSPPPGVLGSLTGDPLPSDAVYTCSMGDALSSDVASAAPAFNLGVGWGKEKEDVTSEAYFSRGAELATLEIYYDDAAGLSAYGVQLSKEPAVSRPFPVGFSGFCKRPSVTV